MQNNTNTPIENNQYSMAPHSHNRFLTGLLITFNILLIVLLYLCFYKYFVRKQPSSTATTDTPDSTPPSSPRNTRAIDLNIINSIPIVEFKITGVDKAECAVCLNEFKDGDKMRVLPRCNHRFHVECVDTWFQSHANCPLCRTPIEEKARVESESMV